MTVSDAQRPAGQTGASERRPITVLFADIAGSTAIAERLDPEDWTALIGEAFQRMNRTVERYDGTIARLMGDGVLAFLGAPTAHEDDPERAVRCGLDLVRAIEELDASKHLPEADKFKVRVGINTGPVVVGVVGTATASEYTAMGDTVNVAARMQASARPARVHRGRSRDGQEPAPRGATRPARARRSSAPVGRGSMSLVRGDDALPPRDRSHPFDHRRHRDHGRATGCAGARLVRQRQFPRG